MSSKNCFAAEAVIALTHRRRLGVALALGGIAAFCIGLARSHNYPAHSDWLQVYHAAVALRDGSDPYATVDHDGYPLYYPLSAAVLVLPLTMVSEGKAHVIWAGLTTAAACYALLAGGWWGPLALGSAPFLNALLLAQWSPLLIGATAMPWIGMVWVAKPTVGLALLYAYPSRKAVVSIIVLVLVSLAIFPTWPLRWLAVIDAAPHIQAPAARPGGALLLLSLLRWRKPEARLLAVLSIVPHTAMPYELLPVFLIPRSLRQMGALVLLSQVAFAIAFTLAPDTTHGHLAGTLQAHWPIWLILVYLPALAMVLSSPRGLPCLSRPQ